MSDGVTEVGEVSIEHNGRVLTGIGVSEDTLGQGLRPAAPESSEPTGDPAAVPDGGPPSSSGASPIARDERGQFAPKPSQTAVTTESEPKPPRGQTRFSQLTSERDQARNAAAEAAKRAQDLEAELARYKTPSAPQGRNPAELAAPQGLRRRPRTSEIGSTYADWDAYEADLGAWDDERVQALQAEFDVRLRQSIEADRTSRATFERADRIRMAGRQAYADFDAVLASAGDLPVWQQQAMADHPEAAKLYYLVAKDPELTAELAAIQHPVLFGLELAKLLTPPAVASPASTAAARISQAPTPIQPVTGGTATTLPSLADLADKDDYAAYKARRTEELRRR